MESFTFDVAGAKVVLPAATLVQLWADQVHRLAGKVPDATTKSSPPAIGQSWPGHGGIYVGVARGQDGQPDRHLIVAENGVDGMTWDNAKRWAKNLMAEGFIDYALPTRTEQALLFANVPELFEAEWYWSGEQYAGGEQYAWSQRFTSGGQDLYRKLLKLRARAVRSEPIE